MPVLDRSRSDHMIRRVRRTLRAEGVSGEAEVTRALARAMGPRHELLDDDHDPRYLHPGRTVLVAITDGGVRDPGVLASIAVVDTLSPELRAVAGWEPEAGRGAAELPLARRTPDPFHELALETLLGLNDDELAAALAEWLDQLRHLRHWALPERVRQAHAVTAEVYGPVARRASPPLARRLDWWLRRVARAG